MVAWAGKRPVPSVSRPSAVPTRRPRLSTIPSALINPVSGVMGSPPDEPGWSDSESPQHEVTFSHGFWLFAVDKEYFLSFDDFPWFRKAAVEQLFNVEFSHDHHLHWPDLDVDLDLARIESPEKFPLVAHQ